MGLFGRRSDRTAEPETGTTPAPTTPPAEEAVPAHGPWDATQVAGRGNRVDLGAIWLPGVHGMQVRMEIDKKTQAVTGASVMVDGSAIQIQAFAAPKTTGIWDEIRAEIMASLQTQGAKVDDLPGPFGRELLAQVPATTKEGEKVVRVLRFIGVDGPRWFLRGVITGKSATDMQAARVVEGIFSQVVVVRDDAPRAPREVLALTLPKAPPKAAEPTSEPAAQSPEGPVAPEPPPADDVPEGTENP